MTTHRILTATDIAQINAELSEVQWLASCQSCDDRFWTSINATGEPAAHCPLCTVEAVQAELDTAEWHSYA